MKINTNNITSASMSNPLIVVIVLLLILIIILAIFRSASPFLNVGLEVNAHIGDLRSSFQIEAFDNQTISEQNIFVMYYANWCGHCKRTKPEFQKLIEEYNGNVKVMMVDCEDQQNKELVQSQGIKGFPTIRMYKNGLSGNYQEYSGDRTYSNFVEYLNTISGTMDSAPDNAAPYM